MSADVITGYGATNELQVDYYSGAGVNIEFFINGVSKGVLPGTALDESAPTGFIAQIGDETAEIFPDEPVFNLYQQSLPVAFGGADAGAHARIIDKSGIAKHLVGQAQKPPQSGRPLK